MRSLFELKTRLPFDSTIFCRLKETATGLLRDVERSRYTQAIVLYSVTGNQYGAVISNALSEEMTEETTLLNKAILARDTEIRYVVCMWQDQSIDIPSYAFREKLCACNPKNKDSLLFVMTPDGVAGITVSAAMK